MYTDINFVLYHIMISFISAKPVLEQHRSRLTIGQRYGCVKRKLDDEKKDDGKKGRFIFI